MSMGPGHLRERVAFQRRETVDDGMGNKVSGNWNLLHNDRCALKRETGLERMQHGTLTGVQRARLTCYSSNLTRQLKVEDQAVIDGEAWQIRSIDNPDMKDIWLVMLVETGVAQ